MSRDTIPYDWLFNMIQTGVGRPYQYEQGDVVYGVKTAHIANQATGGKLYADPARAKQRYREIATGDYPLYKPDIHAVVVYSGTVSTSGPADMRDTMVVDPSEEAVLTLTDIDILAFHDVGDQPDETATLPL